MVERTLIWLLAFALLGGGGLIVALVVRASLSPPTFMKWRKRHMGVAFFFAYWVAISLWGLFGSCGDDCAVDPSPLFAYSFLQIPGWFIGIWLGGRLLGSHTARD